MPEDIEQLKSKTIEELLDLREQTARIVRENDTLNSDYLVRKERLDQQELTLAAVHEQQRNTDTAQRNRTAELDEREGNLKRGEESLKNHMAVANPGPGKNLARSAASNQPSKGNLK